MGLAEANDLVVIANLQGAAVDVAVRGCGLQPGRNGLHLNRGLAA